jgi:hypothetical protein
MAIDLNCTAQEFTSIAILWPKKLSISTALAVVLNVTVRKEKIDNRRFMAFARPMIFWYAS